MRPSPSQLAALRDISRPDRAPVLAPANFGANLWNRLVAGGLALRGTQPFHYAITAEGEAAILESDHG